MISLDLYLLRHGEAGKSLSAGVANSKRALTLTGQREIEGISRSLQDLGLKFDSIITSPFLITYHSSVFCIPNSFCCS
jgi:phosphohistidine phosphatase